MTVSTTKARKTRPRHLLDGFPPDTRIVAVGVTWDDYENLVNEAGDARNCRIAFDGNDIEMMTLGPWHESEKSLLEAFIAIVAGELKIERRPMGSTTWKRKNLKRAIESDLCYYFDPVKLAAATAAAHSDDVSHYPNPDLAVEVDISPPKIDRPGIYAALQVAEFWRARKRSVSIEQLGPDGRYVPVPRSRFLPVRPEEVTRWVFNEDTTSLVTWEGLLRGWIRAELQPRDDPARTEPRPPGIKEGRS
jgi:Uma2 family endonuclease